MKDNIVNIAFMGNFKSLLLTGAATVALFMGSQASAQAAPTVKPPEPLGLEDIIVTARKQAETLMRVPVAASAISSAQIQRYGISDLSSIGEMVPSASFERSLGSGGGSLTIRGIGSSGTDTGIEQTVATVLDGVQTSRGQFIQEGLMDIDRVEVLKGPQALFFGKNSPGGVLSLVSKGPTDKFEAYGKVGYEFRAHEKIFEGAVSGPLTDTLRARLALRGSDMRGWMRNVAVSMANPFASIPGYSATTPPRPYTHNGSSDLAGRLTVDYKPNSDFTATLRLFGSGRNDKGDSAANELTRCAAPPTPEIFGVPDPTGDCKVDGRNSIGALDPAVAASSPLYHGGKPFGHYRSYLGSLTMEYASGPATFTSVTGYVGYKFTHANSDNTTYAYPMAAYNETFHQLSEELRVVTDYDGLINFSGGVYVETSRLFNDFAVALAPGIPDGSGGFILQQVADPATGRLDAWELNYYSNNRAYSAFGQARWNILQNVELAGGVRYTYETHKGATGQTYLNPALFPIIPLAPVGLFPVKVNNGNFSPELTLSWHPMTNSTLYVAYKTGYKSGGIGGANSIPFGFDMDDLVYKAEHANGVEVGFKSALLDNSLRITGALYHFKYRDLQISNFDANTQRQTSANIGGAISKGGEIEIAYKPIPQLTLNGALGYSRSRYSSFRDISCYNGQTQAQGCVGGVQDLTGQAKVRAPDWTGNVGFNYDKEVLSNVALGISGGMRFSSKYFTQENNSPFAVQHSYQIYDASIRLRTEEDRWQIALIGRNLDNRRYAISSFDNPLSAPGTIESSIARGREVTLEVTFRY